jgi:hypothetical protein
LKNGEPVLPLSLVFPAPLTVLYIKAVPVSVTSIDGGGGRIEQIVRCQIEGTCKFFYIGKAEGQVVLFDSVADAVVFVPVESVVLEIQSDWSARPDVFVG